MGEESGGGQWGKRHGRGVQEQGRMFFFTADMILYDINVFEPVFRHVFPHPER